MLTGIIGILGALAGLVPALLQYLSLKANNAQQIELRKLEIEAARQNIALQVDLKNVEADIEQQRNVYNFANAPSGIKWVDALAVFVRPYITLIMFHVWIAIEVMLLLYGIANGVTFNDMVSMLWDADTKSMFAAIIGFWFGDRMGKRNQQQMAATTAVMKINEAKAAPLPSGMKAAAGGAPVRAPAGDRPGFP